MDIYRLMYVMIFTELLVRKYCLCIYFITLIVPGAVPKRILEFMNVPGLTRENVASHLQVINLLNYTFTF